jgi:hypothetical protein
VPGHRERRRPGHFRICGACGKRNKARRAECSRCGEPLRGIPEATPGTQHAPPPPPRQYRWLVAAVVLVAVAAGVIVQRIFTTGTLGSAAPTAEASPWDAPSAEPVARPTFDATSAERYAQVRGSVERGQRLLARGDFRGAASLLADAARLVPEDPRIANAYGHALLGLGSRDRALHQFERAARLDTGVTAYRLDYARALAEAGRTREAAREYEAVAVIEPGNAGASEGLLRIQQSPPTDAGSTSVDLGGASSGAAPAPASGGAFTNEDLQRGTQPMRPPTPISSPLASPRPFAPSPSPSPSPYSGPFASPSPAASPAPVPSSSPN